MMCIIAAVEMASQEVFLEFQRDSEVDDRALTRFSDPLLSIYGFQWPSSVQATSLKYSVQILKNLTQISKAINLN